MTTDLREMPLFPLHTVLFPGMVLPLHIFEPKYKLMINECVRDNVPFGVVMLEEGTEGNPGKPFPIGTSAYVTHVYEMDDGRMNIQTVGYQRFRIHDTHRDRPYLTGLVEDFPFESDSDDDVEIARIMRRFTPALQSYLNELTEATDIRIQVDEMPTDGMALAIFAAIAMPLPMEEKQDLLSINSTVEMLRTEQKLLKREALLLGQLARANEGNPDTPFSVN